MIKKATADDGEEVFDIRRRAILAQCIDDYPIELIKAWTDGDMPVEFVKKLAVDGYVEIIDNCIAATGMVDLTTGIVDAVFVCPNFMQQGLGRKMLSYLEAAAKQAGVRQLHLDSTLNAATFYRHCGFVGNEVAIYHSPRGLDLACIPMCKKLNV